MLVVVLFLSNQKAVSVSLAVPFFSGKKAVSISLVVRLVLYGGRLLPVIILLLALWSVLFATVIQHHDQVH